MPTVPGWLQSAVRKLVRAWNKANPENPFEVGEGQISDQIAEEIRAGDRTKRNAKAVGALVKPDPMDDRSLWVEFMEERAAKYFSRMPIEKLRGAAFELDERKAAEAVLDATADRFESADESRVFADFLRSLER